MFGELSLLLQVKKNSVKNRKKKLFYVDDGLQVYAM